MPQPCVPSYSRIHFLLTLVYSVSFLVFFKPYSSVEVFVLAFPHSFEIEFEIEVSFFDDINFFARKLQHTYIYIEIKSLGYHHFQGVIFFYFF